MARSSPSSWPVLTRYDQEHLSRIAMPLGGIGTGTVSLGGRGDLRDWEVVNRPAKGFVPQNSFFALYAKPAGRPAVTRALEGPIESSAYEGGHGSRAPNHGLPRFRNCSFEAAYPLAQVHLSDPDVPLDARIEAHNPLIPADADRSGIPVAVLRFVMENRTHQSVAASVCGSVQNFIGTDGSAGAPKKNVNVFRRAAGRGRVQGLFLRSEGVDPLAEQWGTMALVTTAASGVTYRTAWPGLAWGDALLDFWDDFSADGALEERDAGGADAPVASLAISLRVPAGATRAVTFLLAWHFPNRMTWTPAPRSEGSCCEGSGCDGGDRVGNYYATQYSDAWDVVTRTAASLPTLEADTVAFVRAFSESDLPAPVKEAALCNLSTLRTQTCFRTADGRFFGWEGCSDQQGCCLGSCTHVWNYEQATAFLFGDLARSMREVEFGHATDDRGLMSFRAHLPLGRATAHGVAAADGQMGSLMKLYRDWRLSGDDRMLRALWPKARKALEFAWVPGGWDADRDGVMEGAQHNTMDVEYYGPNPEVGVWYLGALRAAEEMARHLGENDFAGACRDLFERGSRWLDENLFNGEYYEHQVRPPRDREAVAPGLRHWRERPENLEDPEFQIGPGCMADQLVGQLMAHVSGLGYLLDPDHVRKAFQSLMRHNFKESLLGHFNNLRTYALGDEAGMLVCAYPRGRRPKRPFPYFNEVWTGLEYTAAAGMVYEGLREAGLKVIAAARARHDGRKRNPFDEPECGHHYARAMASWAAVLAFTGFSYSGLDGTLTFAAADGPARWFWSNGDAWGTCGQEPGPDGAQVEIAVLGGALRLKWLALDGVGSAELGRARTLRKGESVAFGVKRA